ncbi:cytosolic sulfotransferase 12-like [Salvia hispanica]|uniref:cytosolic sulfotransferase 12-like n=1 Tax=Salvia hispanica TaxID=49212 RepID=UPI002009B119|nr:cytosolic sulfotransferase 12-like [Salvia hispanica]
MQRWTDSRIAELPRTHFIEALKLVEWEGYWCMPPIVKAAVALQNNFEARNDDVFLASCAKTGTTWLKSLAFCIMQRQNHQIVDALTLENPHFLVPTVEAVAYSDKTIDIFDASAARLLHTHLPHALVPDSVRSTLCKIIYIARNPKDTVVSSWHFFNSFLRRDEELFPFEKFIDCFCSGKHPYGPFLEHVMGYWEESKKNPKKILFLKYEELKIDPKTQVLKIAEFLERPFEDDTKADEILSRCSIERLKNFEVNKSGSHFVDTPNSSFFRKGEVGDWNNYLTSEMEMKIDNTICLKLRDLGLYF